MWVTFCLPVLSKQPPTKSLWPSVQWASVVAQWRICLQCRRPGFHPWVRNSPWNRKWQPTPVLLPGESHWVEGPGRLQSMRSQRVGQDWMTNTFTFSVQCWSLQDSLWSLRFVLLPQSKPQVFSWLVNSELTWYRMLTQANQTYPTPPQIETIALTSGWVKAVSYTYSYQSTYSPFFSLFMGLLPIKLTPEGWEAYLGHLWILSNFYRAWSRVGI